MTSRVRGGAAGGFAPAAATPWVAHRKVAPRTSHEALPIRMRLRLYHGLESPLPEEERVGDNRRAVVRRFEQEAGAFARSPVHRDPKRLERLLAWAAPVPGERALDVACGPGIVLAS